MGRDSVSARGLRSGHLYAQIAACCGIGTTTACQRVAEGVEILTAFAPNRAKLAPHCVEEAFVRPGWAPANTLANASRYDSFWDKSAVVIRDIAGGRMFDNGNKRTAQSVVEQLMERNGVTSGPSSADLRRVIDRVGKGQLHDISDISSALRGY
jgi:prophage maintenance system killer protein